MTLPLRLPLPSGRQVLIVLAILFPLAAAVLGGAVIALGSAQMNLIVVGLIAGAALLLVPSHVIVVLILGVAMVGVGLLIYYARVGQAHWLVYLLCLALWIKLPIEALLHSHERATSRTRYGREIALVLPLIGLFIVIVVASVHNQAEPVELLIGARNYIFIWSLAFVVGAGVLGDAALRRVWLLLLAVAALQAPFAALQHVISAHRGVSWDAIVGTFGGDPDGGGGGSGSMVIYLSITLGAFVALSKAKVISPRLGLFGGALCVLAVLMAETKAFLVLGPLAVLIPLVGELRRRPAFVLVSLTAMALVVASVFAFYQHTYNVKASRSGIAASDYLDDILRVDTNIDFVSRQTGEVSRLGAPLLWWREGWRDGPTVRLFGYGMRASRVSNLLGKGKAARRHAFNLTTSSVSALLWEVGVLGLACFSSLLLLLGYRAWRLSRQPGMPAFHAACLEATASAAAVLLVSMVYNDAAVDHHTIQTVLALLVGYVIYWERRMRGGMPEATA